MNKMTICRTSPFTGKANAIDVEVDIEKYWAWESGELLIQDAMPHLSAEEREFIKTGITPEEWKKAFG